MSPRSAWLSEFREVVWLASVVSGLSVLGVGVAVGLAFVLDHWAAVAPVPPSASLTRQSRLTRGPPKPRVIAFAPC
jgi:hypothetical protein